jgi:hypothetical protein
MAFISGAFISTSSPFAFSGCKNTENYNFSLGPPEIQQEKKEC